MLTINNPLSQGEETFVNSPEPDAPLPKSIVKEKWPATGSLEFRDMCLRYSTDGQLVLKNISAKIASGLDTAVWHRSLTVLFREKVGVVGRTGAGKSSLIAALFRLAPIEVRKRRALAAQTQQGDVIIDGTSTAEFPLAYMRSKIGVIPQDPVLFRFDQRPVLPLTL